MATIGNTVLTLLDQAKRMDPDGNTADIVNLLVQSNPILEDMLWKEGNLPTGNRTTVATGLPSVVARRLNDGVAPSKGTTAQFDDGCAMIEGYSEVDVDVLKLNGNDAVTRAEESMLFMESMNQTMAQYLFYGNATTNPERFNGFATRYPSLTVGEQKQNVLGGGGVGSDMTSLYLVGWGPKVYGLFPKGDKSGLIHEDLGEQIVQTGTGIGAGRLKAHVDRWQWKCGLVIKDWRYVVRAANIDVSNLVAESSAADLVKLMVKMWHRIPNIATCRPVFYVSRSAREMLDIQALNKATSQITVETIDGKLITMFRGVPIKTVDQILESETNIT
jgi:hypothetical protein